MSSQKSSILKIKTKTWEKDSYGLFDFEAKEMNTNKFEIEKPFTLIRERNRIFLEVKGKDLDLENYEKLCSISRSNGDFFISNWRDTLLSGFNSKDLWLVIGTKRFEPKSPFQLKEGDVFKAGRLAFRVLQIRVEAEKPVRENHSLMASIKLHYDENLMNNKEEVIFMASEENVPSFAIMNRISNSRICRICLSESNDNENPLISPCQCSGSLKFVHFKCLQTWVQSRLHLDRKNGIVSIEWNGLGCELCKSSLPLSFKHNNTFYDLLQLREQNKENFDNYLVLESYSKHFERSGIHYIDFTQRSSISIGRSELAEIRLTDISVSREHSRINFEKGQFHLVDGSSKFGTLVLVSSPIRISNDRHLFQNGRTLISLKNKQSWFPSFSLCPLMCNYGIESNDSSMGIESRENLSHPVIK